MQTRAMNRQQAGAATGVSLPYLRRGARPPASKSVFESMALDGACHNALRKKIRNGDSTERPNPRRTQTQSCHGDNRSSLQQQQWPQQQKQKQVHNQPKTQQFETQTKSFPKNCYLKRGGCVPASASMFETLALDGAGYSRLRQLPRHAPPAANINAFVQQKRTSLELSSESRSRLNGFAFDTTPRALNSCWKQEVAQQVKQSAEIRAPSLTQHVQRTQPLCAVLNSQMLTGKSICNGRLDQIESVGCHMKLESKSLEALGDTATDLDTTSGVHFRMNSESSVCSMVDTQEWMSESDWFFH